MNLILKDKKRSIGFSFAWQGIVAVIKSEKNFQIHLIFALLVILISFYVKLNMIEWIIIVLTIGLVLLLEMINTIIEKLIDFVIPEIHPTAKLIKDIAAGAVLVSAIMAIIVGLIIFTPKILLLF